MTDIQAVDCPQCGTTIKLTDVLLGPIRDELTRELRPSIEKEAQSHLESQHGETQRKLSEMQAENRVLKDEQLELRKQREKLERAQEDFELEKQRAIDAERASLVKEAERRVTDRFELELRTKEEQLRRVTEDLEEARQRATQSSQELQGTVQEMALDERLRTRFPTDDVSRISRGRSGGDVVQTVREDGIVCGSILWESKVAKTFSKSWLAKLREDMRNQGSDVAVLVTSILPDDCAQLEMRDGVWIATLPLATCLAEVLRTSLVNVERTREVVSQRESLAGNVYDYVTSDGFIGHINGVIEFMMKEWTAIQVEQNAQQKRWSEREEALHGQARHLTKMIGELHGIGAAIPEMPIMELAAG